MTDADGTRLEPYVMRTPCRYCDHKVGRLEPRGGQNCVFCVNCGRLAYNAPKTETGQAVRTLASRPDIKPSKRARILERDNHTCVGCHEDNKLLIIGHLISVKDGTEIGMTDADLYDDLNLASFCEECNTGQGARSIGVILQWWLHQIWQKRAGNPSERPSLFDDE